MLYWTNKGEYFFSRQQWVKYGQKKSIKMCLEWFILRKGPLGAQRGYCVWSGKNKIDGKLQERQKIRRYSRVSVGMEDRIEK